MSLEVERLVFRYPGRPALLHDISFRVGDGENLCLLGPNGSGKTTLLRCLVGIHPTESGAIRIKGQALAGMSRRDVAREIAYVPQSSVVIFPFTVLDMVLMGRTPHLGAMSAPSQKDVRIADDALDRLSISQLARRSFNELSGGERQLVWIARAICQEARLMILDEPTASLDYGNQIRVLKMINRLRESGYTIIMTAHNPDHAFLSATHAAVMSGGRMIATGDPHTVLTSQRLSELYSARISVFNAAPPEDPAAQVRV
jgi:iron complex transport system ATP-binding protein